MLRRSQELALVALFIALIAVLQLLPPPFYFITPWGMRIDLVAIPVLIAFFVFGLRTSLLVSVGLFFALSIVAAESVVGASMKWIATMPMIITPAILTLDSQVSDLKKDIRVIVAAVVSMVAIISLFGVLYTLTSAGENRYISPVVVLVATAVFYFAFYFATKGHRGTGTATYGNPKRFAIALVLALIVRGVTTTVVNYYFSFPIFFDIPTAMALEWVPWYVMFGLNILQGTIDVTVAWLLVFKSKAFSFVQKAYIPD